MSITVGTRVEVPRHFKPRGTKRIYDRGTVIDISDRKIATVAISADRQVICPIGLLTPIA